MLSRVIAKNVGDVFLRHNVLITNRKSHMGFRLVTKSVTLNDLKRRNSRVVRAISPNSVAFCGLVRKIG